MMMAHGLRRKCAHLAAIPAAAVALLMAAGSVAVAAPSSGAASAVSGRDLQTLFGNVRVFGTASTESAATGELGHSGTSVSVTCWTTGTWYNGSPIWYRISVPLAGYVAALNMAAHFAPPPRLPHCASPPFNVRFNPLE